MTQLPHELKRIRLNLARSKEFPNGSERHGYEFVAPLDASGHIDVELWRKNREHCGVRRFWEGEGDKIGRLPCSCSPWCPIWPSSTGLPGSVVFPGSPWWAFSSPFCSSPSPLRPPSQPNSAMESFLPMWMGFTVGRKPFSLSAICSC